MHSWEPTECLGIQILTIKLLLVISIVFVFFGTPCISDLLTIQFRLSFKDKGHKSLEYYCLVIHLTSVISTISYPQSNGDIFIVIAP